jgi:hypothetical protein
MTFAGVLHYASARDLEAAIAAIEELLEEEDDDFDLGLRRRELALRVDVDVECRRDWYLAYETLIEALAAKAISGEIVGEIDETITAYAPPKQSQIAGWLVPLIALPELETIASVVA